MRELTINDAMAIANLIEMDLTIEHQDSGYWVDKIGDHSNPFVVGKLMDDLGSFTYSDDAARFFIKEVMKEC